jgi:hypothetical protein
MSGRRHTYNVSYHFCQQFIDTGSCDAGYYCRYAHPLREEDRLSLRESDGRRLEICQRHMAGRRTENAGVVQYVEGCKFGSNCRFSHCEVRINPSGIRNMLNSCKQDFEALVEQTGQTLTRND